MSTTLVRGHGVRLAVLGGGNMAQAIILGAVHAGSLDQRDIVVAEPDEVKRRVFTDEGVLAVAHFAETADRIGPDTQLLLAVKPQMLPEASVGVRAAASTTSRVVISVLAGTTGERVRAIIGAWARVVRVMPNTPARIGRGVSAIALSAGTTPGDDALAREMMGTVGSVVDLEERLFDAFTAVAGSGPAYLFYLAEAMIEGAVRSGMSHEQADAVVRAMLGGSASLLEHEAATPARALRAAVTSQGGTTAAAMDALDAAGVMDAVAGAVVAARDRGRELGRQ